MPETPDHPGTPPDTDNETPPGMPRWVKVSATIGALLALALIAFMLIGGSDHGPGRHANATQFTGTPNATAAQTLDDHDPSDRRRR